jgi:hypothetical protein
MRNGGRVGGQWQRKENKKKKICREEREEFAVAVLPLVRIWVRREPESPSVGGGERFMWGLQGLKTRWREKEGRKKLAGNRGMTSFLQIWTQFSPS